jgi:hypothetical protein
MISPKMALAIAKLKSRYAIMHSQWLLGHWTPEFYEEKLWSWQWGLYGGVIAMEWFFALRCGGFKIALDLKPLRQWKLTVYWKRAEPFISFPRNH